jgi:hypothetical protein
MNPNFMNVQLRHSEHIRHMQVRHSPARRNRGIIDERSINADA